ncbi:MAG: hypothetical protein NT138_00150 [Planctomycetales bacterium]|nr:hypothetical protein [Planctomycetales bacterium]
MINSFLKRGVMLAAMVACSMFSVSTASAAFTVSVGQTIKLYNGPGSGNGGEFIVKHVTDGYSAERFRTFCVQTTEYFNFGETLTIDAIADFSSAPANPIKATTSALYREFMRGMAAANGAANYAGTILGVAYTFNSTTDAQAGLLQQAIWNFQGQGSYSNAFVTAANSLGFLGADATSLTGTNLQTYGYVQALQLKRSDGAGGLMNAQDQLYWDGRGQLTAVPEPASIALWGTFALGGLLRTRRRRNSA